MILNALFLVAYLLSALVQYNDPDPWAWIAIYAAAAGMCIACFARRLPRWVPTLLLVVSLLWTGSLLPALGQASLGDIFASVSMQNRAVEEAREVGGLALIAIWSAVLMHRRY